MKINGPGESSLLLLKVIKVLEKIKIPYAIVGAFAVSFYGLVRLVNMEKKNWNFWKIFY